MVELKRLLKEEFYWWWWWWCWGGRIVVIGRDRERLGKKGLIGGNWVIRLD